MTHSTHLSIKLVAALAMLLLAGAATASLASARHTSSAADQVRATVRAFLKAEVAGDTARAGSLLASDFQEIDVTGTAASRRDNLANIGGGIDFVKINPNSPIQVRLYGSTAVARYKATFVVLAGGDRVKHRAWTTDLLERRQGRWQFVWSQTTAVPNNLKLFIESLKPIS